MRKGSDHHNWQGDDIGYAAAHDRVRRAKGSASDYSCRRCGSQAHHWCYDHLDVDEVVSAIGEIYSTDPDHYMPLCRSCHAHYDRRNLCRRGHRLTDENSYVRPDNGRRWCKTCENDRKQRDEAERKQRDRVAS